MRALPSAALALLCFAIPFGSAFADNTMCDVVAGRLHPGALPPASLARMPGLFEPIGAGPDAQIENDVVAELQKDGATPGLMARVKAQANCDTCGATLTWFANHTAAAIFNEAGDMHCVSTTSVRAAAGHLEAVDLPPAFGDDCPDTRLMSGQSDHQAYLLQEATRFSADPRAANVSVDTLILARWDGTGWGQPCQVRDSFPMSFFELHMNCADGFDCGQLRALAITDAGAAQDEQRGIAADAMEENAKQMALFAEQYARKSSMPAANTDKFPDFKSQPHTVVFMDRNEGLDGTGLTRSLRKHNFAGGHLVSVIWQEAEATPMAPKYPSWVVTQWLEANNIIRPIAGFVVHQKPGVISGVSTGPAG
jgi:hypothetical protein